MTLPDLRPLPRATVRGMSTISEPCPECDGSGSVYAWNDDEDTSELVDCPECYGTGGIETEDCREDD